MVFGLQLRVSHPLTLIVKLGMLLWGVYEEKSQCRIDFLGCQYKTIASGFVFVTSSLIRLGSTPFHWIGDPTYWYYPSMFILMLKNAKNLETTQRTSVPWSSWWLHSISFSSKEIGFRFRIASFLACVSCKVYAVPPPADWYPPPEPEMIVCQETTWRFWAAL